MTHDYTSKTKRTGKSIQEMQRAIAQDKLERAAEERVRMAVYQALTVKSLRIVQIPAENFDQDKENEFWRGRCIFAPISDERTSVSVDVPGFETFNRWNAEVEEVSEDKPETVEEEPEREDGLTVVTAEEMEEVAT